MTKTKQTLMLCLFVFIMAGKVWGNESQGSMFTEVNLWNYDGAYEQEIREYKEILPGLQDDKSSSDIGGIELRVGVLFPTETEGLRAGGSLGYIAGPGYELNYSGSISAFPTPNALSLKQDLSTVFLRGLFHIVQEIPMSEEWAFKIHGGVGIARGKIKADYRLWGVIDGSSIDITESQDSTWTGFTWEISPSIVFKMPTVNIDIGIMFAGLPTMKEDDDWYEFKWNPMGLKIGVGF